MHLRRATSKWFRSSGHALDLHGLHRRPVTSHVGHDEYATYANSLLANGIALVPQYGSASRDQAALDLYDRLGFQAVGVDCRLLIECGGAVHCVSMQVPAR